MKIEDGDKSPCCGSKGGFVVDSNDLGLFCSHCNQDIKGVTIQSELALANAEKKKETVRSHGLIRKEVKSVDGYQPEPIEFQEKCDVPF